MSVIRPRHRCRRLAAARHFTQGPAMTSFPGKDPAPGDKRACEAIDQIIVPRSVDLGGFSVRRALPHMRRRMVGPFIFFDHFGPAVLRDGHGTAQPIRTGEVNWMTAGRGIVHSERTAPERRVSGGGLHGLQCWIAMPTDDEEIAPSFAHHDQAALPIVNADGANVRIVAGSIFGQRSPVVTLSETLFADATLALGATLPFDAQAEERALYIVSGEVDIAGDRFGAGQLLVFRPGDPVTMTAASEARVVLIGGAAMDGPRYIWWNFVSSRKDRIEQAKAEWKERRFDIVPGDETEFIPLPE